jgi:hypothetical protein
MLQDTIVAIRRGGDKLVVANLEAEQYPEIEFGTDPTQARIPELLPHSYMLVSSSRNSSRLDRSRRRPISNYV